MKRFEHDVARQIAPPAAQSRERENCWKLGSALQDNVDIHGRDDSNSRVGLSIAVPAQQYFPDFERA